MTKINLREQYPDFYKTDYIIEVPDEVAAVMKEHDRLEAAYMTPGSSRSSLAFLFVDF